MASLALVLTGQAEDDVWRAWGVTEVESARWQHGRIDDDNPHWCHVGFAEAKLPSEGLSIGTMVYNDTYLTGANDHKIRRFLYENDLFPYLRHDWRIADGWVLHSQLLQTGLTFLSGFRNEYCDSKTFYWDYRGTETLDTPWCSVWFFFRKMINNDSRLDVNWGAYRSFRLPFDFTLRAKLIVFGGDSEEAELRYGIPPDWRGRNRYGFSMANACLAEATLVRPICGHFSAYVSFREFALIDSTVRRASSFRTRPTNYRDLAIVAVGIGYDF